MKKTSEVCFVEFGGMVFMYGNMQIFAEKKEGKVVLTKQCGSDGFTEDAEEIETTVDVFESLVEALDSLNIESNKDEDEENTVVAVEEADPTGAHEWYVAASDSDENVVMRIRGYNDSSEAFKAVSKALTEACEEFGCIEKFFESVNE